MIKDGIGGANTKTGLHFEERVDIKKLLQEIEGYELIKTTNNSGYKDTLDYIHSVNCHYMFNEIPLKWLGLPN